MVKVRLCIFERSVKAHQLKRRPGFVKEKENHIYFRVIYYS
jgi:hypothetical protein